MTPSEIAHEVDRRLLPQRIEPIGMAAMKLHVPISAIRYFQHIGWLPAEFDLAFILELIHHPELEQWRKMLEARRNYRLLCMHDPSLSEDEALEIDIKNYTELRPLFPPGPLPERHPLGYPDYVEDALHLALERIAGAVSA